MMQADVAPLEILHALGIDGESAITPVTGGFDMAMWKVEHEGRVYALRVLRAGAHGDCERERVVMAAVLAAGLPVPEVSAAGVWQERPALLISWLPGRTVADELRAHPWLVWRLGRIFGRMQAEIHAVAAPNLLCPGTVLQHDLVGRYKPDAQELAPARRWTNRWKKRAGIAKSEA